jgi:hypothetical protein
VRVLVIVAGRIDAELKMELETEPEIELEMELETEIVLETTEGGIELEGNMSAILPST